jgi:hypothetical protein
VSLGQRPRVRAAHTRRDQLEHQPALAARADTTKRSEVEVRFFAETEERTRVELDHRHLERHGGGWQKQREELEGEGGWPGCLRKYAERVKVRV